MASRLLQCSLFECMGDTALLTEQQDQQHLLVCQGFDEVSIATIGRDVLRALEYMHGAGRIHRDIKASRPCINVMLCILLQFGHHFDLFGLPLAQTAASQRSDHRLARNRHRCIAGTCCRPD